MVRRWAQYARWTTRLSPEHVAHNDEPLDVVSVTLDILSTGLDQDPHLVPLPLHRICQHTVDPEAHQRQRSHGGEQYQRHLERALRYRIRHHLNRDLHHGTGTSEWTSQGRGSNGPADRVEIPFGAQVIDLSRVTVLPVLIDGHTHIFGFGHAGLEPGGPPDANISNDTREFRTLLALANAQKDLTAGFTTLRDVMSHGGDYADVDARNAINRGFFMGPRMQVSTMGWRPAKAYSDRPEVNLPRNYQTVDLPWAARRAVREQIDYGADWIKFHSTAGYRFDPDGKLWCDPTFTFERRDTSYERSVGSRKGYSCMSPTTHTVT